MALAIGDIRYARVRQGYRAVRVISIGRSRAKVAFRVPSTKELHTQGVPITELREEPIYHVAPAIAPTLEQGLIRLRDEQVASARCTIRSADRELKREHWKSQWEPATYEPYEKARTVPTSPEYQAAEKAKVLKRKAKAERVLEKLGDDVRYCSECGSIYRVGKDALCEGCRIMARK